MKQMKTNDVKPIRLQRWIWLPLVLVAIALRGTAQPNAVSVEKDVVYGQVGEHKLLLDVYRTGAVTADQPLKPALIAVHGGGWRGGSKNDFAPLCRQAAGYGYVAFSVNYRLVKPNANKFPAQIDDVQRAVRWVRANAGKYGVDPNRIGALGASAGGHLVALLGTTDTRDNSDPELALYSSRVNAVVDLFGPSDLTAEALKNQWPTEGMMQVALNLVRDFIGKTPEEAPELYRQASPVAFVDKKTVPFLIFHGTADPLVPLDQSQRLHKRLQEAGIESQLVTFEGEGHGFTKPENQQRMIEATRLFLDKHLGKPAP